MKSRILIPFFILLFCIIILLLWPNAEHSNRSFENLQLTKAAYKPEEEVVITFTSNRKHKKATFIFLHGSHVVEEREVIVKEGKNIVKWLPPTKDFQGYLLEVRVADYSETIGIDVSSDWSKFPRYGFLSSFQPMTNNDQKNVVEKLNRYHINGVQFYDWHFKHEEPLPVQDNKPLKEWEDIANRPTSFQTVQNYIELAHQFGMEAMSYNLLYGAFKVDSTLPREWALFKDPNQQSIDEHPLPEAWKSNVMVMNPSNPWWQDHLIAEQQKVYDHLDFDGWHIDQLGERGEVFNELGDSIDVADQFSSFVDKITTAHSEKDVVMNGVNQFGQEQIAAAQPEFLYTEVWDDFPTYTDIKNILEQNQTLSKQNNLSSTSSVLAAYMNYNHANLEETFNEAGVLLMDAVVFANGGAHIELGEHMLSKEYFPNKSLKMSRSLEDKLVHYYDFLTAYQNWLREDVSPTYVEINSEDRLPYTTDGAEEEKLWILPKEKENKTILHFINLLDSTSLEWRDTDATQRTPKKRENLTFTMYVEQPVKKVWTTSPDVNGGKAQELEMKQDGNQLTFTLPSLEYWGMVVIEN
ncbi:glycoside hydrolase family 66 protein [Mangrovibacillus cuniculi]|uniref:Cycloisomaltooligosaccharide glucanotransferase n=1 Tax=Mangrovibacillus cuniculi TaxID=2593652 RepID=A0A7S8HEF8_9BACI|nr:glycoside hydrolase family 66 protein [Mangrovibacillus cuniculi]QPC45683.1 hypothetical protein G8O30_01195 [Mangrovibacillus cuniculi]